MTIVSVLTSADFILNVEMNPLISPKAVIMVPTEDNPKFTANPPRNIKEAIEVYIRYFVLRIFQKTGLAIGNLKPYSGCILF